MASLKKRKPRFEVPISATSIPIVVSGFQMATTLKMEQISTTSNYLWTFSFPNTLKWIVVQKIIVYYTMQHNKQKTYQLKKLREKRLLQQEAAQLQKRSKILVDFLERPPNSERRKQFKICTKRERLDEGVFMKKKPNPNKKVGFSAKFYRMASTVDDIDQMNLS